MTVAELRTRREQVRDDLAENRRHLVATIRRPAPEIANLPIGDLLCWCDGLDEAAVTTILAASEIRWGQRVRLLSAKDQAMLCWQIKARYPETWERWKASVRGQTK